MNTVERPRTSLNTFKHPCHYQLSSTPNSEPPSWPLCVALSVAVSSGKSRLVAPKILFFVKTDEQWINQSLRQTPVRTPTRLSSHVPGAHGHPARAPARGQSDPIRLRIRMLQYTPLTATFFGYDVD